MRFYCVGTWSHRIVLPYLVTLLYLRASLYPGNAVSATSSAGRISVSKHFHLRWPVGIDKLCHVKNAVRISSSLSRISQDLRFVWDGGQIMIEPSLERVHFAASHVSNISWKSITKLLASYWESSMLQGLYIPWGVMVDTWDLTFSSTSDVPDRLHLCPTI